MPDTLELVYWWLVASCVIVYLVIGLSVAVIVVAGFKFVIDLLISPFR